MRVPKKLVSALIREDRFIIAVHTAPDGDALGSALALSAALKSMGKDALVYSKDPVPRQYRFLPASDSVSTKSFLTSAKDSFLVLVDCNMPDRAGVDPGRFRGSIVIDHHETEGSFGDIVWSVPEAAATGMLIYYIIRSLGAALTKEIATNIYAAIAVDTGTFRYGSTSSDVLRVCADLVDAGAAPSLISDDLYQAWGKKRFNLLVAALNTLEIRNDVAFIYVTKKMLKKTGARSEDTENFSDFPRMLENVRVSVFIKEFDKGAWKLSLRSKGTANVARVAARFGGGGHRNAAGCKISADLKIVPELVYSAIRKLA